MVRHACISCGYDLSGLAAGVRDRCPECGESNPCRPGTSSGSTKVWSLTAVAGVVPTILGCSLGVLPVGERVSETIAYSIGVVIEDIGPWCTVGGILGALLASSVYTIGLVKIDGMQPWTEAMKRGSVVALAAAIALPMLSYGGLMVVAMIIMALGYGPKC